MYARKGELSRGLPECRKHQKCCNLNDFYLPAMYHRLKFASETAAIMWAAAACSKPAKIEPSGPINGLSGDTPGECE